MADPDISPLPIPETDTSLNPNSNPLPEFNPMDFPPLDIDFLNTDLSFMDDLEFDGDFDISFDDLNFPSDGSDVLSSTVIDQDSGDWLLNDDTMVSAPVSSNSSDVSRVLNSPSPESGNFDGKVDRCMNDVSRVSDSPDSGVSAPVTSSYQDSGGCTSVVDGFLNSLSPESGVVSESTHSPSSSNVESDVQEVKVEEEGKGGCALKRKKEDENPNNPNTNPRCSKFRKSSQSDNAVAPEEDKKKARLMRNRESAQMSRQRKKHYVEELEDKVRSMHTVIANLNSRISFVMAENASLRQQLCGGNVAPPPGLYPPPNMAPMGYPWIPCAGYPMNPQGTKAPLVPIPRLKPRQPVSASKAKKSESKKSESKTKKVSSVTFLGLLFFVMLFWGLVPLVNVRYGGKTEMGYTTEGFNGHHLQDRVLGVNTHLNGSHQGVEVGHHSGKSDLRECGANRINCRRVWVEGAESKAKQGEQGSETLSGSNEFDHGRNSSEPLVASLYVPRNDKLVKIDGNLIIHSVLASEKAMASGVTSEVKSDKGTVSSTNESPQTSLAISGNVAASLSIANGTRHSHMYRSPSVQPKALNSGSGDSYKEGPRSTATDGSLQKWFREGLAGPILSSGMCTEVFQFDVSSAANLGGIIPATSTVNVSTKNASEYVHLSKRNRRILKHLPIPLPGSEFNHTGEHAGIPSQSGHLHKNKSVSSMIVSVLFDPREGADREVDGGIAPKSLSRIFVVVLIDSVKYVTYSCMLPFKGSSSHLVTA